MNNEIRKEIFNELRVYVVGAIDDCTLTDDNIVKAITVNENLKSLGYTLKPKDIVKLARKKDIENIYNDIKEYIGDVKAKPMYPDFPKQVMEMEEAEFRFHQLLHYFSTYGVEFLSGCEVSKGWLPEVEETNKTKSDKHLLDLKVIELYNDFDISKYCIENIAQRNERLTKPQKDICNALFSQYVKLVKYDLSNLKITFKQNLLDFFYIILYNEDLYKNTKIGLLRQLCQHTGDVLKCIDYCLVRNKYHHFATSEKNMLVQLIESYVPADFKVNVIISNKKADRVKLILNYLDYNKYSKSLDHKNIVRALRNDELQSWEGKAKYLLSNEDYQALNFVSNHPGTMIRMIAWLLRIGYTEKDILTVLLPKADRLSMQTLVTVLTYFGTKNACTLFNKQERNKQEHMSVYRIFDELLDERMKYLNTKLKGCLVYFDLDAIDIDNSTIECNNKSSEGGYVRSGLAYKLPEDVNYMRFFVYWNDKRRIDIDLHAFAKTDKYGDITIGYNTDYNKCGIAYSGDVTHSDAAEYINVDMNTKAVVSFNINSFTRESFGDIDEVFTGLMAVDSIELDNKLYDAKNCYFHHFLRDKNIKTMNYGILDTAHRFIKFIGKETKDRYFKDFENYDSMFTLRLYLMKLINSQNIIVSNEKEKANFIVTLEKSTEENSISLLDNNFFMED